MKKRLLFILCLFVISAGAAFAQTKNVTNANLEKFRQKRLQAEQEYRENYAKLGFPSPEELEKQREKDRRELSELAAQLRKEDAEREQNRREDEYRRAQNEILLGNSGQYYNRGANAGDGYYPSVVFGSYPIYGYPNNFYYNNRYWNRGVFGRRGGGIFENQRGVFSGFGNRGGSGIRIRITATGGGFRGGGGFGHRR